MIPLNCQTILFLKGWLLYVFRVSIPLYSFGEVPPRALRNKIFFTPVPSMVAFGRPSFYVQMKQERLRLPVLYKRTIFRKISHSDRRQHLSLPLFFQFRNSAAAWNNPCSFPVLLHTEDVIDSVSPCERFLKVLQRLQSILCSGTYLFC